MLAKVVSYPSHPRQAEGGGVEGGWWGGGVINNVSAANNFTLLKICSIECTLKCMMYTLGPLKTIHCDEDTSHTILLTVKQNLLHCFKAAHCSISQPNTGHVRSFGTRVWRNCPNFEILSSG